MSSTSKTLPRCSTMWEELNKIKIEGKSKLITFSVRVEKGKYLQKRKERNEKMLKTSSASEWVREACERERKLSNIENHRVFIIMATCAQEERGCCESDKFSSCERKFPCDDIFCLSHFHLFPFHVQLFLFSWSEIVRSLIRVCFSVLSEKNKINKF